MMGFIVSFLLPTNAGAVDLDREAIAPAHTPNGDSLRAPLIPRGDWHILTVRTRNRPFDREYYPPPEQMTFANKTS
jgi:hypothetical protein